MEFVYSDTLIEEIRSFSKKTYFKKQGIKTSTVETFIDYFQGFAVKIIVTSKVKIGRDQNDHYLLSLARDANVHFLVTGDPDLLLLEKYAQTQIINMKYFLNLLP